MNLIKRIGCALAGVALAVSPMATPAMDALAAKSRAAHERFVPLEGGQNFRDLGGYRTSNGRSVKWGLIYRSATMGKLSAGDFQALKAMGVRTVVDLRASDERKREPFSPPAGFAPAMLTRDYELGSSELAKAMRSTPTMTAETARNAFVTSYATVPFEFAGQYRQMFAQLLARNVPLIVNCSAGKDRTGVAAALILTALGVPRATIMQDYLLSNPSAQPRRATPIPAATDPRMRGMAPDVAAVLAGVDAPYLDSALKAIESRPGGMNGYFRNELGLTPADLRRLKTLYLER